MATIEINMHKRFLLAALQQAWLGRGICAPNPSVGAVAVHLGNIIAEAWHQGPGLAHAEQAVLAKLPPSLSQVTLYVTLEPCNHWGRTPPCVDAIIAYGVTTVVYAYKDPNELVAKNNSTLMLTKQGVNVIYYPLEEIEDFYKPYHYWLQTKRPWVVVKIAQSLDGKIAGKKGERVSISNHLCQQFTHKKRLQADAILTTASTINKDDPLLNVRHEVAHPVSKPIVIINNREGVNPKAKIFSTAQHCYLFDKDSKRAENLKLGTLKKEKKISYHTVNSQNNRLDLLEILTFLGELGMHEVWVEAGAELFNALHQLKLVQQTYIYIAPIILGKEAPLFYENDFFNNPHSISWQQMDDNMIASMLWG
jgi:diaminohydroxyphosphoribosylaminopyrimidine deaminase/5-amino-6-(5-phosphoribosylamino)uracil reductase